MTRKRLIITLFTLCCLPIGAQKRVGDYVESTSYNEQKRGAARELQYYPDGDAFVCINGKNRFTRALYGGWTTYRLETSDRPVFALFQNSRNCRNVRFVAKYDGRQFSLDSTTYCEARYEYGCREYVVKDTGWQNGTLRISVVCRNDCDGALWHFSANGFTQPLTLCAEVSGIANKKLNRNGDMGADPPGSFETDGIVSQRLQWVMNGDVYIVADTLSLRQADAKTAAPLMEKTLAGNKQLANQVRFTTPDAYLNPLGGALMMAADGAWDGETWLHGAIGWRTQLAGWRAGYLADVLGWNDRAISHFNAYQKSQVTAVPPVLPHPAQDSTLNLARAVKKWGTPMYSNGYLCRKPGKNDAMNHYDMNLNFVDELLWHFQYDADTTYMRQMWPLLKLHLEWEKRNFDPDGDHLYDGYCCIWASDALYYSGGAATHASAYNQRGFRLAARIAELLGEDPTPYRQEANDILAAMNSRLWVKSAEHWAECQDLMGLKRVHPNAAIWSIYTPIDCGVGTMEQMSATTRFVDERIPHINVTFSVPDKYKNAPPVKEQLQTISTSNWMPYAWSINNVASAEVMNMVLAYFKAGRAKAGFQLLKANIMDQMYLGDSPANFGQVSFYDAARGECYRDFSDNTGISARALIQGLFGIVPQALYGQCVIHPGFPQEWNEASIETPYLKYRFHREKGRDVYEIEQHFSKPLLIVLRQNTSDGTFRDIMGTTAPVQRIEIETSKESNQPATTVDVACNDTPRQWGLDEPTEEYIERKPLNLASCFNAKVDDIYKNEYLSPRPPYTTLQIPKQGVGEWCHPQYCPEINDSLFRTLLYNRNTFSLAGVTFRSPMHGKNIAYTSLWDNYPDSVSISVRGHWNYAYLLMAGSTNHMQSHIENALVVATYTDNSADTLRLVPPYNWCPIEQDYFVDGRAFQTMSPRPYRISLGTGVVSRDLGKALHLTGVYGREISGGAAQMLKMPLNVKKKLRALTLRTLSNDVVVGLMAVTLER